MIIVRHWSRHPWPYLLRVATHTCDPQNAITIPRPHISSCKPCPITQSLQIRNIDILGCNFSTELPHIGVAQRRVNLPALARQPTGRITCKGHIGILESATRRILQLGACAAEVSVRAHEQRQLGRVVRAEPWLRRYVGEVAGVEVTERRATSLLAEASGLSSWAEESGQGRLKGNRLVGSARVVWGEGNTVLGICADDGWLLS